MRLAIGTAQFGLDYGVANTTGIVSKDELSRILNVARKNSIDLLDTASAYGVSEERLGEEGISDFGVVSKLAALPHNGLNTESWINEQINLSLARLKVSSLYGLLVHRSKDLFEISGKVLVKTLMRFKEQGIIKKIGVSIYNPQELPLIKRVMPIDIIQAPLNLIDRRLELQGWIDWLNCRGVELHVRSIFLQGLLLLERQNVPQQFRRWDYLFDRYYNKLERLKIDQLTACLNYPLQLNGISRVIVGVDNSYQLNQMLACRKSNLNNKTFEFMSVDDETLINPFMWSARP